MELISKFNNKAFTTDKQEGVALQKRRESSINCRPKKLSKSPPTRTLATIPKWPNCLKAW